MRLFLKKILRASALREQRAVQLEYPLLFFFRQVDRDQIIFSVMKTQGMRDILIGAADARFHAFRIEHRSQHVNFPAELPDRLPEWDGLLSAVRPPPERAGRPVDQNLVNPADRFL